MISHARIVGSAVEHHIDIVGVTGSIPVRSTISYTRLFLDLYQEVARSFHSLFQIFRQKFLMFPIARFIQIVE